MTITLNGMTEEVWGLIEMKSADNAQALQTVGLDFLWVSEAQDIPNAVLKNCDLPLDRQGRMGKAFYEGILPLYPEHWFRRGYKQRKEVHIRTTGISTTRCTRIHYLMKMMWTR